MSKESDELTPMQQLFVREYLKDYNGKQAAIRAGYSEVSAHSTASTILTYPNVIAELNRLQKKLNDKVEVTAERVMEELVKMGFSDIHNFVDNDWKLRNLEEIGEDKTGAIKSVEIEENTIQFDGGERTTKNIKFKLHDKIRALESIAKRIGFYEGAGGKPKETVIKVVKDPPPKKDE